MAETNSLDCLQVPVGGVNIYLALYQREIFKYKTHTYKHLTGAFNGFKCAPVMSFFLSCCHFGAFFLVFSTSFNFSFLLCDCSVWEKWHWRALWKVEAETISTWNARRQLHKKKSLGSEIKKKLALEDSLRQPKSSLKAFTRAEKRQWHFEKDT